MTVFLCEILIYCVLNNQDRQLGDLWPERAVVAIIKDKKRLPNKCDCSVVENHSLKKNKGKFVLEITLEGANIICGCASDRRSTVATPLVGICAGGDT